MTCLTWVSRHEGSHLIQHLPSRHDNQRRSPLTNNPGLSLLLSLPWRHHRQQKQKPWSKLAPVMLLVVGPTFSGRSGGGVFLSRLLLLFPGCPRLRNSYMSIPFSPALENCRRGPMFVSYFSSLPTLVSILLGVSAPLLSSLLNSLRLIHVLPVYTYNPQSPQLLE